MFLGFFLFIEVIQLVGVQVIILSYSPFYFYNVNGNISFSIFLVRYMLFYVFVCFGYLAEGMSILFILPTTCSFVDSLYIVVIFILFILGCNLYCIFLY